jgi:hypothetical protein
LKRHHSFVCALCYIVHKLLFPLLEFNRWWCIFCVVLQAILCVVSFIYLSLVADIIPLVHKHVSSRDCEIWSCRSLHCDSLNPVLSSDLVSLDLTALWLFNIFPWTVIQFYRTWNRFLSESGDHTLLQKATVRFVMSLRPHGTTWLGLDGFPWNLIFEYFSKICWEDSCVIKIWREYRVHL